MKKKSFIIIALILASALLATFSLGNFNAYEKHPSGLDRESAFRFVDSVWEFDAWSENSFYREVVSPGSTAHDNFAGHLQYVLNQLGYESAKLQYRIYPQKQLAFTADIPLVYEAVNLTSVFVRLDAEKPITTRNVLLVCDIGTDNASPAATFRGGATAAVLEVLRVIREQNIKFDANVTVMFADSAYGIYADELYAAFEAPSNYMSVTDFIDLSDRSLWDVTDTVLRVRLSGTDGKLILTEGSAFAAGLKTSAIYMNSAIAKNTFGEERFFGGKAQRLTVENFGNTTRLRSAEDTVENLDKKLIGNVAVAILESLLSVDGANAEIEENAVFFSLFGITVVYGEIGLLVGIFAVLLLTLAVLFINRRKESFVFSAILSGALVQLVSLLLSAIIIAAVFGVFFLIDGNVATLLFQDGASSSVLTVAAILLALIVAVISDILSERVFRVSTRDVVIGNIVLSVLFALVSTAFFPGWSFLFVTFASIELVLVFLEALFLEKGAAGWNLSVLASILSIPVVLPTVITLPAVYGFGGLLVCILLAAHVTAPVLPHFACLKKVEVRKRAVALTLCLLLIVTMVASVSIDAATDRIASYGEETLIPAHENALLLQYDVNEDASTYRTADARIFSVAKELLGAGTKEDGSLIFPAPYKAVTEEQFLEVSLNPEEQAYHEFIVKVNRRLDDSVVYLTVNNENGKVASVLINGVEFTVDALDREVIVMLHSASTAKIRVRNGHAASVTVEEISFAEELPSDSILSTAEVGTVRVGVSVTESAELKRK